MKIAVTAAIPRFRDAPIDPLFGRCNYFLIVETDDMSFEVVENEYAKLGEDAGMESAKFVASKGVKAVLTGSCGSKVSKFLTSLSINVIVGVRGAAKDAVENFITGEWDAPS